MVLDHQEQSTRPCFLIVLITFLMETKWRPPIQKRKIILFGKVPEMIGLWWERAKEGMCVCV